MADTTLLDNKSDENVNDEIEWMDNIRKFLEERSVENIGDVLEKMDETNNTTLSYRLIYGDIVGSSTTFEIEWQKFLLNAPEWNQVTELTSSSSPLKKRKMDLQSMDNFTLLFYSSHKDLSNLLVIRCQTTGLCHMNAPVVLQHYLVTIATNGAKNGILNVGLYEASKLSGQGLVAFLTGHQGGSSELFLSSICGITAKDVNTTCLLAHPEVDYDLFLSTVNFIAMKISQGQPALVSCFMAHQDFMEEGTVRFEGDPLAIPDNREVGLHAMLLIGIRKVTPPVIPSSPAAAATSEEDGAEPASRPRFYFLLQNWWKGKYFIEVDDKYLCSCNARIAFVHKPLTDYNLKNQLHHISPYAPYSESFDKPEELMKEWMPYH